MPPSKPVYAMREERIAAPHPSIKSRPASSHETRPQDTAAVAPEKPAAAQAESEPQAKPPGGREIVAFSELPLAVQQALPKLSISGFVQYPGDSPGDADKRMIGIGERLAQQGDEISPGLKVEQIAGDRVVFGYKGYRFWLGVH
jgi:general secretion pathway protein B